MHVVFNMSYVLQDSKDYLAHNQFQIPQTLSCFHLQPVLPAPRT